MSEHDPRLIENPVRLSESKLWEIQRNYFANMGIQAWKEEVPCYISSNAFIGYHYALLVIEYIKDTLQHHPKTATETFYIAELGAGTGKFSFYFLKAFKELLMLHRLTELTFCYVVTDIAEKNLEFCEKNACFASYIKNKELDFALFNVEDGQDFHLRLCKKSYSELRTKAPLIIIANYTFDCIKQDTFEMTQGKLQEEKVGLRSRYKDFNIEKAKHLNDLQFTYQNYDINPEAYYQNSYLNEILQDYATALQDKEAILMIPLGAIQFLDHLKALTHGHYFMIVGDKGISQLERIPLLNKKYRMTYDGCYSFFVNLHCMGEYIKKNGGDCLLTANDNNFKVSLFSQGASFNELKNTNTCFSTYIERVGPDEYCYIYDEYLTNSYRFNIRSMMSFLRLSQWDTYAYSAIHDRLIELLPIADRSVLEDVKKDLEKVRQNTYHLNIGDDIFNYLGIFYQTEGIDDLALSLYEESIAVFGDRAAPHNNAAMIYDKQHNTAKALFHYEKARKLDKKNKFAARRFAQLTGKLNFYAFIPLFKLLTVLGVFALLLYFLRVS